MMTGNSVRQIQLHLNINFKARNPHAANINLLNGSLVTELEGSRIQSIFTWCHCPETGTRSATCCMFLRLKKRSLLVRTVARMKYEAL
jgi:hypothetical protein